MAIRLRLIRDSWVALCAARSMSKPGDIYLNDGQHHAVQAKVERDCHEMHGFDLPLKNEHADLAEIEESNNPNRDWWDKKYATK
jgi:hypothetical protein